MDGYLTLLLIAAIGAGVSGQVLAHGGSVRPYSITDLAVVRRLQIPATPPPLRGDTSLLHFEEFFNRPIGPRGLVATTRLMALDGQRVRLFGYMVLHDVPLSGRFILAPRPVTLAEKADGQADDLPPAVVTVIAPPPFNSTLLPYVPGMLLLEGRLQIGVAAEPDGRLSYVRLLLDWPPAVLATSGDPR